MAKKLKVRVLSDDETEGILEKPMKMKHSFAEVPSVAIPVVPSVLVSQVPSAPAIAAKTAKVVIMTEPEQTLSQTASVSTEIGFREGVKTQMVPVSQAIPGRRAAGSVWVMFTMFQDVDPSPTIGPFDFTRELSMTALKKGDTFECPREVAEVMVDKKFGVVVR